MIKKNSDFCGWYIPELKDSSPELGITIITVGTKDVECHDVTYMTRIIQDSSTKTKKDIPKVIYSSSVKGGIAAHFWSVKAFLYNDSEAETLLRQADGNSGEENRPDLIEMTPNDYFERMFSKRR